MEKSTGNRQEWYMQGDVRRDYATTGPTIHPRWKPWVGPKNCKDCSEWKHPPCGQNPTRPTCFNCQQCHLADDCTFGTRSLEEMRRQQEEDKRHIEEEKERLINEEEERVRAYKETLEALEKRKLAASVRTPLVQINEQYTV